MKGRRRYYFDTVLTMLVLLVVTSTVTRFPSTNFIFLMTGINDRDEKQAIDKVNAAATAISAPHNSNHGGKHSVSLVTSFWAAPLPSASDSDLVEDVHPHRAEIEAFLLNNMNNPHFDQVVVVLDSISPSFNCTHFYQRMQNLQGQFLQWRDDKAAVMDAQPKQQKTPQLICVDRPEGQPNYFEMFHYATDPLIVTGDVVALANADQAFDETAYWAGHIKNTTILALSTWGYNISIAPKAVSQHLNFALEKMTNGTTRHNQNAVSKCHMTRKTISFDVFVFHRRLIQGRLKEEDFTREVVQNPIIKDDERTKEQKILRKAFFKMNEDGAESAALHAMLLDVPEVKHYRGCSVISAWHFHLFDKMHNTHTSTMGYWRDVFGKGHVPRPWRIPDSHIPYEGAFEVPPMAFAINK